MEDQLLCNQPALLALLQSLNLPVQQDNAMMTLVTHFQNQELKLQNVNVYAENIQQMMSDVYDLEMNQELQGIDALKTIVDTMNKLLRDKDLALDQARKYLDEECENKSSMEAVVQQLKSKFTDIRAQKNEVENQLQKQIDQSGIQLLELDTQNVQLTNKYNQLLRDFELQTLKLQEQQSEHLKELEQQAQELRRQLNAETQHHDQDLKQVDENRQQTAELQGKVQELSNLCKQTQDENKVQKQLYEEALSQMQVKNDQSQLLQQQLSEYQNANIDMSGKYNDLLNKFDTLQLQQQQLSQQRLAEMNDQQKELEKKFNSQLDEVNKLLMQEKSQKAEIERMKTLIEEENQVLKTQVININEELTKSKAPLDQSVVQTAIVEDINITVDDLESPQKKGGKKGKQNKHQNVVQSAIVQAPEASELHQQQMKELTDAHHDLTQKYNELLIQTEVLQQKSKENNQERINEMDDQNKQLVKQLNQQLEHLEDQLKVTKQQKNQIEQLNQSLSKDNQLLQSQMMEVQDQLQKSQIHSVTQNQVHSDPMSGQLSSQVANLSMQLMNVVSEKNKLNDQISDLRNQLATEKKQKDKSNESKQQKQQFDKLLAENTLLKDQLQKIESKSIEIELAPPKVMEVGSSKDAKQIKQLEKQIQDLLKECERLKQQVIQLQEVKEKFDEQLKVQSDRLRRDYELQKKILDKQMRELATSEFDKQQDFKREQRFEQQRQPQVQVKEKIIEVEKVVEVENLEKIQLLTAQNDKLKQKQQNYKDELDKLNDLYKQDENQISILQNKIELLDKQLKNMCKDKKELENQVQELSNSVNGAKRNAYIAYGVGALGAISGIYCFTTSK